MVNGMFSCSKDTNTKNRRIFNALEASLNNITTSFTEIYSINEFITIEPVGFGIYNADISTGINLDIINISNQLIINDASLVFASNNYNISINAPDDLITSYNLFLPYSQGNSGELLKIDGSGQLYFDNNIGLSNLKIDNELKFNISDTSSIVIKAPRDLSSSYDLSLPYTQGNSGDIMKIDGNGQLYFSNNLIIDQLIVNHETVNDRLCFAERADIRFIAGTDENANSINIYVAPPQDISVGYSLRLPKTGGTKDDIMKVDECGNLFFDSNLKTNLSINNNQILLGDISGQGLENRDNLIVLSVSGGVASDASNGFYVDNIAQDISAVQTGELRATCLLYLPERGEIRHININDYLNSFNIQQSSGLNNTIQESNKFNITSQNNSLVNNVSTTSNNISDNSLILGLSTLSITHDLYLSTKAVNELIIKHDAVKQDLSSIEISESITYNNKELTNELLQEISGQYNEIISDMSFTTYTTIDTVNAITNNLPTQLFNQLDIINKNNNDNDNNNDNNNNNNITNIESNIITATDVNVERRVATIQALNDASGLSFNIQNFETTASIAAANSVENTNITENNSVLTTDLYYQSVAAEQVVQASNALSRTIVSNLSNEIVAQATNAATEAWSITLRTFLPLYNENNSIEYNNLDICNDLIVHGDSSFNSNVDISGKLFLDNINDLFFGNKTLDDILDERVVYVNDVSQTFYNIMTEQPYKFDYSGTNINVPEFERSTEIKIAWNYDKLIAKNTNNEVNIAKLTYLSDKTKNLPFINELIFEISGIINESNNSSGWIDFSNIIIPNNIDYNDGDYYKTFSIFKSTNNNIYNNDNLNYILSNDNEFSIRVYGKNYSENYPTIENRALIFTNLKFLNANPPVAPEFLLENLSNNNFNLLYYIQDTESNNPFTNAVLINCIYEINELDTKRSIIYPLDTSIITDNNNLENIQDNNNFIVNLNNFKYGTQYKYRIKVQNNLVPIYSNFSILHNSNYIDVPTAGNINIINTIQKTKYISSSILNNQNVIYINLSDTQYINVYSNQQVIEITNNNININNNYGYGKYIDNSLNLVIFNAYIDDILKQSVIFDGSFTKNNATNIGNSNFINLNNNSLVDKYTDINSRGFRLEGKFNFKNISNDNIQNIIGSPRASPYILKYNYFRDVNVVSRDINFI